MRIMRGKTFEGKRGQWEKIEIELDSSDLLPDEASAAPEIKVQLLELRAEKNIVIFMQRQGKITKNEAEALISELSTQRKTLLTLKPKPVLRQRA